MPGIRTTIAAATLATALPAHVLAQRPVPRDTVAADSVARRLPAVEVLGSLLPLGAPAVGADPTRVAIVDAASLASWRPRLLADALQAQPGLSTYDDLGSAYKPTIVTRGFAASPVVGLPQGVSVFLDGVPVNEPDAGQVNFDLLPLRHLRRVEVLAGTASLLGPNSLGGAVNLVTRHGGGAPGGEIELTGGSYGRRSAELSAGGDAGGWQWYAGGGHDREGGWRQLTSARLTNAVVNLGRLGDTRGVGLQALAARSRAETAGSLPLSVYDARPDSNLTAGDFEDLEQLHFAATAYAPLGAGRATAGLWLRHHDAERFNVNQRDDPDVRAFSRNRTLGLSIDWQGERAVGGGTLGVRMGAGGSLSRTSVRLLAERIDPGLTTHVESPIRKLDAYALADWQAGRLTLSGGARHDVVRVPFRNRLDGARDTTSTYARLSPRGGASVALGGGVSLQASAGRGFRAPAVIELACADPEEPCPLPFALGDDPPLAPVVATTWEGGLRWSRGMTRLDATAYRTDVRDDIFLLPYEEEGEPEGSTIDGYFANLARTRREGVELAGRVALPGGHAARATWAATRATFQSAAELFSVREIAGEENDVEPGDRLPLVPERTATVGATLLLPARLDAGVEARHTGRRWLRGDEANGTAPLPSVWLVDANAGWSTGQWELRLVVRNVLDRRYASFGTFNVNQAAGGTLERFLTPGLPRTIELALRRRFGAE